MAEDEFVVGWGNPKLLSPVSPELIQVALDPPVADHFPFPGLSTDGQDCPNLISQGSGGRNVPPPQLPGFPDPDASVSKDQDVQGEVEPLPLSSLVLGSIDVQGKEAG